jgi:hypothetical protein
METVTADIPELSSSQAPVAVEWQEGTREQDRLHARFFDGDFYVPAAKLQRDADKFTSASLSVGKLPAASLSFDLSYMLGYPISALEWHEMNRLLMSGAKDAPKVSDIKETVSSDVERRRETAERVVSSLVSVDGILYRKVEEPVIVVSHHEWRGTPEVSIGVHFGSRALGSAVNLDENIWVGNPHNSRFFPLDELEAAKEAALSFGLNVKHYLVEEPTVLIPEAFSLDMEFDVGVRTVEFAVEGLRPQIAKFDRETIISWLEIRERFKEWQSSGEKTIVEELLASNLPEFLEHIGNLDPAVSEGIEAGLGRWDGGNIDLQIGLGGPRA